jgi:hypothetical protein
VRSPLDAAERTRAPQRLQTTHRRARLQPTGPAGVAAAPAQRAAGPRRSRGSPSRRSRRDRPDAPAVPATRRAPSRDRRATQVRAVSVAARHERDLESRYVTGDGDSDDRRLVRDCERRHERRAQADPDERDQGPRVRVGDMRDPRPPLVAADSGLRELGVCATTFASGRVSDWRCRRRSQLLRAAALPPLRPAAFFCAGPFPV